MIQKRPIEEIVNQSLCYLYCSLDRLYGSTCVGQIDQTTCITDEPSVHHRKAKPSSRISQAEELGNSVAKSSPQEGLTLITGERRLNYRSSVSATLPEAQTMAPLSDCDDGELRWNNPRGMLTTTFTQ
ncbi:hypothetical protein LSH36_274g06047, partial [Paralvinella palmiformis]